MIDMFCHWRYVIDNLFGQVRSLVALGATHIPRRVDEEGKPYDCTADDSAYAIFQLHSGVPVQFNSSWSVRVRRDDQLTIQVDGTAGTAVAAYGLPSSSHRCGMCVAPRHSTLFTPPNRLSRT